VRSILSILFYLNCKPFEIYQIHAHGNIEWNFVNNVWLVA
jgi:hypothetical protein